MITQIKSALVSAVIVALIAIIGYVIGKGSIFSLDFKVLIDTGVMAFLTAIASLIKSGGTTKQGRFAGVQVK